MTEFYNLVPNAPKGRYDGIDRPYTAADVQRLRGQQQRQARSCTRSVFWRRHTVLKSGTRQSRLARRKRLSTSPKLWRSARPKRHLMVRQN